MFSVPSTYGALQLKTCSVCSKLGSLMDSLECWVALTACIANQGQSQRGGTPPTLMLSIEAPTSPPLRNFGIVKRRKKEKIGRRKKKKISLPFIQTLDPPLLDGQSVVTGED